MTSDAPPAPAVDPASFARAAYADLGHEIAITRRLLERVPTDRLDWRPHPRSMSLGELATHLAQALGLTRGIAGAAEVDLARVETRGSSYASTAEILARFDANAAAATDAAAALVDDALQDPWTLRHGEHVVLRMPRGAVLRMLGISHLVHHRAQLGVYLRLLDVPVPGTYGPSADEAS